MVSGGQWFYDSWEILVTASNDLVEKMETNSASSDSEAGKRAYWLEELHLLVRSMQALYAELAAKLLSIRLHPNARKRESSSEKLKLKELIAQHLAENPDPDIPAARVASHEAEGNPNAQSRTGTGPVAHGSQSNALSEYFSEYHSTGAIRSFMGRKMRTNTLEHINKALALGRQGNEQGARVHAELAERCMQAAADNMSDEEFRRFRAEVEARLRGTRLPSAE